MSFEQDDVYSGTFDRQVDNDKPACYLAGKFFDPIQGPMIETLGDELERYFTVLRPSRFPLIEGSDPSMKRRKSRLIYQLNVQGIMQAGIIIACTDGYDTGTICEIAIAAGIAIGGGRKIPVVTWSTQQKEMNVMLENLIVAHYLTPQELLMDADCLVELANGGMF